MTTALISFLDISFLPRLWNRTAENSVWYDGRLAFKSTGLARLFVQGRWIAGSGVYAIQQCGKHTVDAELDEAKGEPCSRQSARDGIKDVLVEIDQQPGEYTE